MPQKAHPDLLLAQTLAAPFTPCSQGKPLSLRRLPDGGMVVIAADGRKLWFSAEEVAAAGAKLEEQCKPVKSSLPPVKLAKQQPQQHTAHKGTPLRAAVAPDIKVKHDHSDNP
jgi:hypothetical protein